jgi:hypothetical protein
MAKQMAKWVRALSVLCVATAGVHAFGSAVSLQALGWGPVRHAPRVRGRVRPRTSAPGTGGARALRADITVTLNSPLGIVFEEVEPGGAKGLVVADLVSLHAFAPMLSRRTDALAWVG